MILKSQMILRIIIRIPFKRTEIGFKFIFRERLRGKGMLGFGKEGEPSGATVHSFTIFWAKIMGCNRCNI